MKLFVLARSIAVYLVATFASAAWATPPLPVFLLGVSEYPSWVTFLVACNERLIGCKAGEIGPIEQKWGVDIHVKATDYDITLSMYGSGTADAACLTNTDALVPSTKRQGVAILPTSTSDRADALLVSKTITDITQLRGKKIHGLKNSVSQYCFLRNLALLGEKEGDYHFADMDPGAAALAMQQKQSGIDAIMVWHPFTIETLNKRPDVHALLSSGAIPLEIVDMVVMPKASLEKPGGKAFAYALVDTYYSVNRLLNDPARGDDILMQLREKFAPSHKKFAPSLDLQSMRRVVREVKFFDTPGKGIELFMGSVLPGKMKTVVDYTLHHKLLKKAPKVVFGAENSGADLQFDPSYMIAVAAQAQ